jgi:protein-S-isoprenylcysteine O-methyltransferase Ste14
MLHINYTLGFFIVLGTVKIVAEMYAVMNRRKGVKHTSQAISKLFIVMGFATPVVILVEIVIFGHLLPLFVTVPIALVFMGLQIARVVAVRTLGRFYSVDVRVFNDHKIVKKGIYKYFRHPLYLIGLFDYPLFPLACGAYMSSIVLGLSGWILILVRRHKEEKVLIEEFGNEYLEYKKETFF